MYLENFHYLFQCVRMMGADNGDPMMFDNAANRLLTEKFKDSAVSLEVGAAEAYHTKVDQLLSGAGDSGGLTIAETLAYGDEYIVNRITLAKRYPYGQLHDFLSEVWKEEF